LRSLCGRISVFWTVAQRKEAIQSYNLCKADLANGTANHQADDRSGEVAQLQAENYALKAQLAQIKRQLLALLGEL